MVLCSICIQSADDSSRGLDGIKSSKSQRWFKRPNFLSQPEDQWPNQISAEVSEGDPKIKPAVAVNVFVTKNQTKEGNTNKQHGVHCINRCRIATRGK